MGEAGIDGGVFGVVSPAIAFVLGRCKNRAVAAVIDEADCDSSLYTIRSDFHRF